MDALVFCIGGQKVDKNLSCNSCKRHFINEKQMKNHECAHLQCDLCEAKFMRKGLLNLFLVKVNSLFENELLQKLSNTDSRDT